LGCPELLRKSSEAGDGVVCKTLTVVNRVVTNVPVYTSKAREAELKQQASQRKTVKLRGQFFKVNLHRIGELDAEVKFATDD
jgi:hypothetical protein